MNSGHISEKCMIFFGKIDVHIHIFIYSSMEPPNINRSKSLTRTDVQNDTSSTMNADAQILRYGVK